MFGSAFTLRNHACSCGLVAAVMLSYAAGARAGTLHRFEGHSDGAYPAGSLVMDTSGSLYGTTLEGGADCNCGTIFKLTGRTETIIHEFEGPDGEGPVANLVMDAAGSLYGTTTSGGANGAGTVFKLASNGTETVLHSFGSGRDGQDPVAGIILDKKGNIYGTTMDGGEYGYGTVYKVDAGGQEKVLYSFMGGTDGVNPDAALFRDKAGNLYGTTAGGGDVSCQSGYGCGIVFKLDAYNDETILHVFGRGTDGIGPLAGLIADAAGNLYGTTAGGGEHALGTVYRLAPDGTETVLYAFAGGTDGAYPNAVLAMDKADSLFGTTEGGGGSDKCGEGCGAVFKLASDGTETVLYSFGLRTSGTSPMAGVIMDKNGNLYGTTFYGGAFGLGTAFRLKQ